MLRYKGYHGEYRFDPLAKRAVGVIRLERGEIAFHGTSLGELRRAMRLAVDTYLQRCSRAGVTPSPQRTHDSDSSESSPSLKEG